jgi:o-succinylbenzoate synthase
VKVAEVHLSPLDFLAVGGRRRRGLLLRVSTADQRWGLGEAAPLPGFSAESLEEVEAWFGDHLESARAPWPDDAEGIAAQVADLKPPPSAGFALESALLAARAFPAPLASLLGARPARRLRVHRLVSDLETAHAAVRMGARALKLKAGDAPPRVALARVQALRRELPATLGLVVDANGAWTLEEALEVWPRLRDQGVRVVEQPLPIDDLDDLARLRAAPGPLLALDESVRSEAVLVAILAAGAADAVVLKPSLVGSLVVCRRLARRAARAGVAATIGSSFDGPVGTSAALQLAAALPARVTRGLTHGLDVGPEVAARNGLLTLERVA